jgi:hypothetical protein
MHACALWLFHLQEGLTALYVAARDGRLECLKELLVKGAAVNQAAKV